MTAPSVHVGIMSAERIKFTLCGTYMHCGTPVEGTHEVSLAGGEIQWGPHTYHSIELTPQSHDCTFALADVTIGIGFHWERKEEQRFSGSLTLTVHDGSIVCINTIDTEEYLTSVISSEMSATASAELLKAHAVISRSWLMAQIRKDLHSRQTSQPSPTENELTKWYDHEDHTLFDVCADDHCQRYQGVTRASTPKAAEAVRATRGEVLAYGGEICDARFSKCCGGATEEFRYCWEDRDMPYLKSIPDRSGGAPLPDLTDEAQAERWIRTSPEAFCNTSDHNILSQILNSYDLETAHFYRWKVSYSQQELSRLLLSRTGIDFGQITGLTPVARGSSGRIWKLRISGTRRSLTIGKELEIRRVLSDSHLYSSAFVVDCEDVSAEGIPARFTLTGAGWGHGVGLCQIGAAVMGEKGYGYKSILQHYYNGAEIVKLYD